ncbi:MAG TPA: hypothetical protein VGQ52_13675, partial [Gemmatimonadaceae bacterium]|nr:hypothetical protein [Gemmatimonadaceae bacterium]
MRRTMLTAAVLCFIAAPDVHGQSFNEGQKDCRISSSCERSYFDYVLQSAGAIAFDFFLLSFDGARRQSAGRTLYSSPATNRADRSSDVAPTPSDWRTAFNEDDRADRVVAPESPRKTNSRGDLERTNTLALS